LFRNAHDIGITILYNKGSINRGIRIRYVLINRRNIAVAGLIGRYRIQPAYALRYR
jgi:hypothetical protein